MYARTFQDIQAEAESCIRVTQQDTHAVQQHFYIGHI